MEWITQTRQDRGAFEVSVVRESNKMGRMSWGWNSDDKIIIKAGTLGLAEICAEILCKALNANQTEPPKGA